ncbi:hypothetical protein BKA59DRAFT_405653, partial [Fusarium tricinctum]
IDLIFIPAKLVDKIIHYSIHLTKYKLDYRAIQIEFNLTIPKRILKPRLLIKNTP